MIEHKRKENERRNEVTESWNTRWYTMHTKKKTKAPTDGKNSEDELIEKYSLDSFDNNIFLLELNFEKI